MPSNKCKVILSVIVLVNKKSLTHSSPSIYYNKF